MEKQIIEKNIEFLQKHGVTMETENDKSIYRYGLQILYAYIVNITVIFAISALCGKLYESAVMVFLFAVFQVFGGGYHAKTKLKCSSLMAAGCIAGNILIAVISGHEIFMAVSALVLCAALLAAGPVTNVRHPVSKATYKRSRVISRVALCVSVVAAAITLILGKDVEAAAVVTTLYLYAVSLSAAKIKESKHKAIQAVEQEYRTK
ncbi:MAG: accessory gene regulator B family protein [Oscillospiraceae bacterium]|nr:accessory gene regulator B family protein [Oscillospiraceae bacterium]